MFSKMQFEAAHGCRGSYIMHYAGEFRQDQMEYRYQMTSIVVGLKPLFCNKPKYATIVRPIV